jgi:hypothetical protein
MEDKWLAWAKRLQAISSSGLHFGESDFDKERYGEIAAIANDMLAMIGKVPIERIESLVPDFAEGYATPKIDVRGASEPLDDTEPSPGLEALDAGFFSPHDLPTLSTGRVIEKHIHLAFEYARQPDKIVTFD